MLSACNAAVCSHHIDIEDHYARVLLTVYFLAITLSGSQYPFGCMLYAIPRSHSSVTGISLQSCQTNSKRLHSGQ
eukprot:scaffold108100_cov36-Cyclotella_meneghiniana.AAC.2